MIRKICKTLNPQVQRLTFTAPPDVSSAFPPHVFAGLSSIIAFATADHRDMPSELEEEYSSQLCALYLEEMEPEDEMFRNEVIIVLITVYLMVVVRMLGIEVDKDLKAISIPGSRRLTKTMIHEMAVAALKVAGLLPTQKLLNEVDSWIKIIVLSNWMHGREWFENIPSLGDGAETAERGGIFPDLTDDEDGVVSPKKRRLLNRYVTKAKKPSSRGWDEVARLLPGLGTMMHSRVDWSSEENAERYIGWKEDIMEWISKIERE